MRFDVSYRTVFSYDEPAVESQNELRACPVNDSFQRLIDYRVTVEPATRIHSFIDAWGTRVDTFGVRRPHAQMEVVADASVETYVRSLPAAAPRMEELLNLEFIDDNYMFLTSDPHTRFGPTVGESANRQTQLAGDDVVSTVLAIHRFVGHALIYTPGATDIGIGVDDVLAGGVGVCQDYAHLAVAMCRSLGIPARYVSGYLFTEDDSSGADSASDTVVVQTHAWFEAAVPGCGWLALDPTNGQMVGERHVKIGHGRSYEDVQPLRGAYLGPQTSDVEALVEISRMHSEDLWHPSGSPVSAPSASYQPGSLPMGTPGGFQFQQQQQQQ